MIVLWTVVTVVGLVLASWAVASLPKGTDMMPKPAVIVLNLGPYRLLKHPMYVGNVMFVSGLAGLNGGRWGGIFAALAVAFLAGMLMQYWAGLERR